MKSFRYPRLESYVKGVVGHFANDPRVLAWDLWNEPDNDGSSGGRYSLGRRPVVRARAKRTPYFVRSA